MSHLLQQHLGDTHYNNLSFRQLRPQIDDFKLKPNETLVLFNSLTIDRFERIHCDAVEGQVLVPKLGMTFINQKDLELSMSVQGLSFKET